MKKSIMAAVMAMMLFVTSLTAYAEEITVYDGEMANIPVEYTAESHYSVTIPEKINLNDSSFSMTFYANIADNEAINVSIGATNIELTSASGKTASGTFQNADGSSIEEYAPLIQYRNGNDSNQSFAYAFVGQDIPAGKWSGSMNFYFDLVSE